MARQSATAEQKQAAKDKTAELRTMWKESKGWGDGKELAVLIATAQDLIGTASISVRNWEFVGMQLQAQGLEGQPYVHTRTFGGWREAGRQVRKGEKSTIFSLTWVEVKGGSDDGDGFLFPKATSLFHFDQTDAIEDFDPESVVKAEPREPRTAKERKPRAVTAGLAVIQDGVEVSENKAKGGIEIKFSDRPDADVLAKLKANGFRWSRGNGCWYAKLTDDAKVFAYSLQN